MVSEFPAPHPHPSTRINTIGAPWFLTQTLPSPLRLIHRLPLSVLQFPLSSWVREAPSSSEIPLPVPSPRMRVRQERCLGHRYERALILRPCAPASHRGMRVPPFHECRHCLEPRPPATLQACCPSEGAVPWLPTQGSLWGQPGLVAGVGGQVVQAEGLIYGKVGTRQGSGGVLPGPQAPSCAIPIMVPRGPPAPHQHLCLLPGSQKPAACPSPCLGLCLLPAWFLLSSNTLPFSPLHLSPGEEAQPQSSLRPVQRARTSVSRQGHGVQVCTSHPTQFLGPESLCQATIRVNGVARAACLALSTPAPCPEPVKKVGSRCRPCSWQMELLRLGPPAPGVPEGPQGS